MHATTAGTVLLCGAILAAAGCRDPAGMGDSPAPPEASSLASALPLDLGTLGGMNSSAADINDAGMVVGSSEVEGGTHAFRWTRERGMVDLGTIGGSFSSALRINQKGYILGLSRDRNSDLHIVIWTPDNRLMDLGWPPGDEVCFVTDFNNRNTVVGNCYGDEYLRPHPWKWNRETGYVNFFPAPGVETYVDAIDNDGGMAGSSCCSGPGLQWFMYHTPSAFAGLGAPTGDNGWVVEMNDHHQIVGWDEKSARPSPYPDYWVGPFVWTPDRGFKYLGTLGGWDGYPADINNRGEITGVSSTIPFDQTDPLVGFYYSGSLGMVRLWGFDGGLLTGTGGINLYGRMAGAALTASGAWHAVVWNRPTDRTTAPPLASTLRGRRSPVAGGRFDECLTSRELYRSRVAVGHCLDTGVAGLRIAR